MLSNAVGAERSTICIVAKHPAFETCKALSQVDSYSKEPFSLVRQEGDVLVLYPQMWQNSLQHLSASTRVTTTWDLKPSLFAASFSRRSDSAQRPKMSFCWPAIDTHIARKDV